MTRSPQSALLLFPVDPQEAIKSPPTLLEALVQWQLAGTADPVISGRLLVGDGFTRFLMFLGCSPGLRLEPVADGTHLGVSLLESTAAPRLITGSNTVAPRCPLCRTAAGESDLQRVPQSCDACQLPVAPGEWQWKRSAAFCRSGVWIHGIYPHEAVPNDLLLNRLQSFSGFAWDYAYLLQLV